MASCSIPAPLSDDDVLAKLKQTRDLLIARRIDVLTKPKPSYNIDGQKVDWTGYLRALGEQIEMLNKEIQSADVYEIESIGWV